MVCAHIDLLIKALYYSTCMCQLGTSIVHLQVVNIVIGHILIFNLILINYMNILSHKETSMGKKNNIGLFKGHNLQNCKVYDWHALYSTKFNRYWESDIWQNLMMLFSKYL
jgi:hypothetical protein